jgi:hypothetical protein
VNRLAEGRSLKLRRLAKTDLAFPFAASAITV